MSKNKELRKRIQLDIDFDNLTDTKIISKLIDNHKANVEHYDMLQSYYEGDNAAIEERTKAPDKSNNKLKHGYPSYIVDIMQGYFLGKPPTYTSQSNKLEEVQDIFTLNDEQDENSELGKMCSIKGRGYEIVYIDEDANLRFNEIDPGSIIYIYNTKINPEVIAAIRYYNTIDNETLEEDKLMVEVYTQTNVIIYEDDSGDLKETGKATHYFSKVPIIEYANNNEYMGDFERVLSLIDAYDKSQSDTANDFEEFTDAFLVLIGLLGTENEEINKLKEDKILLLGEGQGAEWLIKEIQDIAIENYKDRLNDDIHKFAKVPDISDENFSGNVSGESMKYKLLALDQVIANKERKFKRALQQRLELVCEYLKLVGSDVDYRDIDITFTINRPQNVKEMVDMALSLMGQTSTQTALAQIPFIDDVDQELQKIAAEMETEMNAYSNFPSDNREDPIGDSEEDDIDENPR